MFTRLLIGRLAFLTVTRADVQLILRMASSSPQSSVITLPVNATKMPSAQFYRRPLPATCIDFASAEGKKIFAEALAAGYMNSFFKLCSQYRTQDEPAYCGLTSLVMALNVLEIDPGRIWKGPWRWYHEDMLDCCTPLQVAKEKGINMEQFVCLARCNSLAVSSKLGTEITSVDELREEIKNAVRREDVVLVASYSRKVLGQTGDGHFSPVAGYHEGRDLVLILDTARFKYPPHWIPVSVLLSAMRTVDSETGKPRGYVLLSGARNQPGLLLFRPSCAFSVATEKGKLASQVMEFTKEWGQFLCSVMKAPLERKEIIHLALSQMVKMRPLGNFLVNMFCMMLPTTQNADKVAEYIVQCPQCDANLKKVGCVVKHLVSELEALDTFQVVKEYMIDKSAEEKGRFLHLIQSSEGCEVAEHEKKEEKKTCCNNTCSSATNSRTAQRDEASPKKIAKLTETPSTNCSHCEGNLRIGPEHAATLFLQVWPHNLSSLQTPCANMSSGNTSAQHLNAAEAVDSSSNQGSGDTRTFGTLLMDFISSDLSRSGQYVREEISIIKFKIREVIKYHSQGMVSVCCESK